ncbi:MAG: phosphomannomutase/phosphoglucomutase [Pseudomonadota bacterium]
MPTEQDNNQNPVEEEVVMESTESQIIENGFDFKKAQENEKQSQQSAQTKNKLKNFKKINIDMAVYQILATFIIAAIFAFLAYQQIGSINKEYQQLQKKQAAIQAQKIVTIIAKRVAFFQEKFNKKQFKKMQDGEQLNSNDLFPGSRVFYYTLPLDHTAIVDNPAQGYAFLDLLTQLHESKSKKIPPLEIIKYNSEYASIVMAKKRINKPADEEITGFYVLLIPTQYAVQLLENIDLFNGSIILTQGAASTIKLSNAGPHITDAISKTQAVVNTRWKISYSSALKTTDSNLSSYSLLGVFALLSLICIFYTLYVSIKYINKLRAQKQKNKSSTESVLTGTSALENKQSISQLGMEKSEALIDRTKKSTKQTKSSVNLTNTVDEIDSSIISDYGIRGIVGTQINNPVFTRLGHAIAQEMENNDNTKLTIGYDGRISSPELYQALIEGLKPYDIQVIELGLVTLPVVYYVAQTQTNGNALMVTAGSSAAEYNGLKILLNHTIYSQQQLLSIVNITPEQGPQLGQFKQENANHLYINRITENFNLQTQNSQKKLNIVVDFGNGITSQIIFDLFKMLGCHVIPLFDELDGNFPNHPPHPGKAENLQQLAQKVKSESADLGLAFNSDGTAIGVVSSNGDIIWADRVLMLLARDLLQHNPGAKILYDVKSTSGLHEWIIEYKGEPELTPSGYGAIKQRMEANKASLAGEFSGHLFFAENANGLDDAFYAAAKILQILSSYGSSSVALFKEIPDKISTPEVLIAVQPGQQAKIMEKILSQKAEFMPAGIITLDGLRVEYEDGWGLVRQSRTSSALSLRFEADTPQVLQRIAEKFKEVILSVVFVKFPY